MLTDSAIKNAKAKEKPYHLTDGEGMYLLVKPNGRKYWGMDYAIHGRRGKYAIGVYPKVSLKVARIERDKANRLISKSIDPVQHRKLTEAQQREVQGNTFKTVTLEWLAKQKQTWAPRHAITTEQRLHKNLLPWLGNRPIAEINPPELLRVLRRIESRGAFETAHRCRTIAGQVFRYGIACGLCHRDPSADLRDALQPRKPKKKAAITEPAEVGGLMRAIDGYQGDLITRCALKFSALTFCRPGEIRHAEWAEFIWAKEEWVITAKRRYEVQKSKHRWNE